VFFPTGNIKSGLPPFIQEMRKKALTEAKLFRQRRTARDGDHGGEEESRQGRQDAKGKREEESHTKAHRTFGSRHKDIKKSGR